MSRICALGHAMPEDRTLCPMCGMGAVHGSAAAKPTASDAGVTPATLSPTAAATPPAPGPGADTGTTSTPSAVKAKVAAGWVRYRAMQPVAQAVIAVAVLLVVVLVGRGVYHQVHPLTCGGISKSDYPDWSDDEFKQACSDTADLGY